MNKNKAKFQAIESFNNKKIVWFNNDINISFLFLLFLCCCVIESFLYIFPVNNFPYLLNIIRSDILIIDVVCVLPHINC